LVRVLIADDFEIIRALIRYVLLKAGDMEILAMASNGQEAVHEAITHCPDVAVLDISMPTMDGFEAAKQISEKCPNTRVLMVSMHLTPYHLQRSMEAGASGYVLKDDMGYELAIAVRSLHQGNRYFSKHVAELAKLYIK
jgi:DNA-binding NarL/FixJ family response regulator